MNTDFWNRSRDGNNLWMCLKWNKKVAHILVWGRFGNFPYLILVNGSGWLITDYRASFCSAFLYTSRWSQSVQSLSHVQLFATPWTAARQASLSITNSRSLLKFMSIESVMPSSHLILCCPLLLLPPIPPSIRVFSSESTLHIRWPKYWSFSFSISPSSEHIGLMSFRMDWLDLLAVQGTLKSSPTPQFKGISSSLLSFVYSQTLISIHKYWKNHSSD